tara:strand:+ start:330 stop:473 length:144 start_codon:yes stop_codon:yes gene_type:complete
MRDLSGTDKYIFGVGTFDSFKLPMANLSACAVFACRDLFFRIFLWQY